MGIFGDMGYTPGAVLLMTVLCSFLGFALENIWLAARKGFMDNRNMFTPLLLGYGIAVMAFYFVLGTPGNLRFFGIPSKSGAKAQFGAYFLLTFVLVSVGEILLGTAIEKTCGIIWWDYTSIPMHITRYTSVPTSLGFTVVIVTFMDCFFERIMDALMTLDPTRSCIFGGTLFAISAADLIFNLVRMRRTGSLMTLWKLDLTTKSFERYKYNRQ